MKYLPHGTTVSIGGQEIGGLMAVSIPEQTRGEAETTDTNSGGDREYIPALRDAGQLELTFRHDPDDTGQQQLRTNHQADPSAAVVEFIVTLPSSATTASGSHTYTFDGFVVSAPNGELDLVGDDSAQQKSTVRVTSNITEA